MIARSCAQSDRAERRVADERHRAGDRLDHHEPERVEVGATVERRARALLRRGVARGADDRAGRLGPARLGERAGEPEVGDAHDAVLVEEEVRGLDVAVDEAAAVRVVERGGDLAADVRGLRGREPVPGVEHAAQRAAGEQLEHHERHAVLAPVVDRHHVRVVQRRRELRLGAEAPQEAGVVRERGVQAPSPRRDGEGGRRRPRTPGRWRPIRSHRAGGSARRARVRRGRRRCFRPFPRGYRPDCPDPRHPTDVPRATRAQRDRVRAMARPRGRGDTVPIRARSPREPRRPRCAPRRRQAAAVPASGAGRDRRRHPVRDRGARRDLHRQRRHVEPADRAAPAQGGAGASARSRARSSRRTRRSASTCATTSIGEFTVCAPDAAGVHADPARPDRRRRSGSARSRSSRPRTPTSPSSRPVP